MDTIKIQHVLCFKKTHNHPLKWLHRFKMGLQLHTQTLTLINGDYTGKKFIETLEIAGGLDDSRVRFQPTNTSVKKLAFKTLLLDIQQSTYKPANCPIIY